MGTDLVGRRCTQAMTPAGLRAQAERARTLARSVAHDEAAPILRAFADELDAKAGALEAVEVSTPTSDSRCGNGLVSETDQ